MSWIRSPLRRGPGRPARGLSLLEVLITLVILAVGLLGLASMQANGMRFSRGALYRSQAAMLANDIMDRMRANKDLALTGTDYALGTNETPKTPTKNCSTTTCSPAEMAEFDLFHWREAITERLPSGRGGVAAGTPVTITVEWDDTGSLESFAFMGEL